MSSVPIRNIKVGSEHPLGLIAGPCVLEEKDTVFRIADQLCEMTSRINMPFVFKASYDKANRTSVNSPRGPGLEQGLRMLEEVRRRFDCPVLSDIHQPSEANPAAQVLDVLQVPALLCRQTDLVQAAARTGKVVNIKKGQFLAPWDMRYVVEKAEAAGATNILVTERGSCFGYNQLVSDMRALPQLKVLGYPVVFDATHSVQAPGGLGQRSGGQREMAPVLALAAVAAGADLLFMETHPDPDSALSDGPNMVPLDRVEALLRRAQAIHAIAHE